MRNTVNGLFVVLGFVVVLFYSCYLFGLGMEALEPQSKIIESMSQKIDALSRSVNERVVFLKILTLKPDIDTDRAHKIASVITELQYKDVNLVLSMINKESDGWDPESKSPAGAEGLMQCLPKWFEFLGLHGDHMDIRTNIRCGLAVLAFYLDEFKDLRLALIAYNRGPNPVHTALANDQDPDNGYAKDVLALRDKLASYD